MKLKLQMLQTQSSQVATGIEDRDLVQLIARGGSPKKPRVTVRVIEGSTVAEAEMYLEDLEELVRVHRLSRIDSPVQWGDWVITCNPKPIPNRSHDWEWVHREYDGAPDSGDDRCGTAATLDEAKAEINRWCEENREGGAE